MVGSTSITRPNTASAATTSRSTTVNQKSPASIPIARPSSASTMVWGARRRGRRASPRIRSPAAGRRSLRTVSSSRWHPEKRSRSSSCSATSRTRRTRNGRARSHQQEARARRSSRRSRPMRRSMPRSRKLQSHWVRCSRKYTVKSSDEKLNRMVNIWNPYQCMVTFNMSRCASLLRVRDWPRYGLSRLQPGPARLRAPRP